MVVSTIMGMAVHSSVSVFMQIIVIVSVKVVMVMAVITIVAVAVDSPVSMLMKVAVVMAVTVKSSVAMAVAITSAFLRLVAFHGWLHHLLLLQVVPVAHVRWSDILLVQAVDGAQVLRNILLFDVINVLGKGIDLLASVWVVVKVGDLASLQEVTVWELITILVIVVALAVSVPVDAALLWQAFLDEVALSVAVLVPAEIILLRLIILR